MILEWKPFKAFVEAKNLSIQYSESSEAYYLVAGNGIFYCSLPKSNKNDDLLDFETNFKTSGNGNLDKLDSYNRLEVSLHEPTGRFYTLVSHDLTDKCTWYQKSTRVTDELCTSILGLIYNLSHNFVIDTTHGRITDEDNLSGYEVIVKVNDVVQTSGYTVNYESGIVTFTSSKLGSTVKVTYSYAGSSYFEIRPNAGKILRLQHAELQFSNDVSMKNTSFEIFVDHPVAGEILVDRKTYKNEKDVINVANLGQGEVVKFGLLSQNVRVFPFNYSRTIDLRSSELTVMRLKIKDHEAYTGEFATVTFYTVEVDE